ncbi:MAG: glycosyltransferase family 4 protein [Oscillatoriales cyanobacterium C42_A2020_001]|nr:glycosyltransferase family 4 protein [Leptolyngbyaceae cyanobacterium C42_A2020_001]
MIETAVKSASILCVGNRWFPKAPGGAERYIYELVHQLTTRGDRVELCATDVPNDHSSLLLTNLASAERSLPQRLWTSQAQFQRRSLTTPDAINLHFALYSFPILRQLPADVPITFNFHGPWALESQQEGESKVAVQLKYWLEQQVFRCCDRFIVLSKAFGEILHRHYNISWEKIHIIPGGVNTTWFQPNLSRLEAREKLGWHPDRPILFTPRRLVHRMGLDKLLIALVQVKKQVPDVWLAIAGKGSIKEALEQQICELDLQDNVKLLGFVPDELLPVAYQAADLTVLPSQSLEGFGLVLVESLACGTPALSTPVGGMPEVLAPFRPELVTTSRESDAIASRIVDLLTGVVPLPSRTACREYALSRFDWQPITLQVRQVLLN